MTGNEKRLQKALLEILAIARSINPGDNNCDIFYKVGQIQGTARLHCEFIKILEPA